jgi:putative transposase
LEGGIRNRADLHLAGCLPYLWRSVKWEEVYLKEYATVLEAREGLGNYFQFYNYERRHQSLNYKTPAEIYFGKEGNLT